jgi:hypothetical protein
LKKAYPNAGTKRALRLKKHGAICHAKRDKADRLREKLKPY